MEPNMSTNNEKEIDLVQLFYYLMDHIVIILLIGIVFGCLGGVYSFVKQKKALEIVQNEDISADKLTLKEVINRNHDAYNNINGVTVSASSNTPDDCYNATSKLYVDFNFSDFEGISDQNENSLMVGFQNDALQLLVSDDSMQEVIRELNLNNYEDMSELTSEDLGWLVSRSFAGNNLLNITVTDVNKDRAVAINQAIIKCFINKAAEYDSIDEVKVVTEPYVSDKGMVEYKTITTEQSSIDTSSENVPTGISKRALMKFIMIGFIVGIFIICGTYLIIFIINDVIRTPYDINRLGLQFFGSVPAKNGNKDNEIKRMAYNIAALNNKDNVMILPVDEKTEISELNEVIIEELKTIKSNKTIISSQSIEKYPKAILDAKKADAVILVSTYGITNMFKTRLIVKDLKGAEVDLLGMEIVEAKH